MQVLPYVEQKIVGGGGFSTVYAVSIHHAQQNLVPPSKHSGVCNPLWHVVCQLTFNYRR
jgi:hypothetical protein